MGKGSSKSSKPAKNSVPAPAKPKEPGLLKQAAATAVGAAVGSSIGHAVGGMVSGSDKSSSDSGSLQKPCDFEWQQFVDCVEKHKDAQLCQQLLDQFQGCRKKNSGKH